MWGWVSVHVGSGSDMLVNLPSWGKIVLFANFGGGNVYVVVGFEPLA